MSALLYESESTESRGSELLVDLPLLPASLSLLLSYLYQAALFVKAVEEEKKFLVKAVGMKKPSEDDIPTLIQPISELMVLLHLSLSLHTRTDGCSKRSAKSRTPLVVMRISITSPPLPRYALPPCSVACARSLMVLQVPLLLSPHHVKGIPALGWIVVEPTPGPYAKEMLVSSLSPSPLPL